MARASRDGTIVVGIAKIDEIEEFKDKQEDIDLDRLCARSDGSLWHWDRGGDEIFIVRKVRRNPAALAPLRLSFAPIASSNRADNESDRRPIVGLRLGTMIVNLVFQADMIVCIKVVFPLYIIKIREEGRSWHPS